MKSAQSKATPRSTIDLIAQFGRRILRDPDMRQAMSEALRILRRLTPANELRVVHISAGIWKEWHATGRRVRDYEHMEWPAPSPAAHTVRFETDAEQFGYASISPASEGTEWVLELMGPQIAAIVMLASAIRRNQRNARSETEMVRAAIRARDEERRRITHELHDDVGQTIAALKLKLRLLQDRIQASNVGSDAVDELRDARESVGLLLSKIRDPSHTLYPHILDTLGVVPALEELAGQVSNPPTLVAQCSARGEPTEVAKDAAVALYRCCQEAVSNAIRHADASELDIHVAYSDEELKVVVEDNGKGFDPRHFYDASGKLMSTGFWTIRQRMNDIGGSFRIGTVLGKGTSVEIIIPLELKDKK